MLFPAGKTTFVLGRNGSGKSTLTSLLIGFYDYTGDISIRDKDIKEVDTTYLRKNITYVPQQSKLFDEDLLGNITIGQTESGTETSTDLRNCIRFAALDDVVATLSERSRTYIGHEGKLLSGGQKQRIALARARLRDAPVLILDEPTSALDRETADAVMGNIRRWRRDRTTIIVTHDLSHINPDDYVYVVASGTVSQEGYRSTLENVSDLADHLDHSGNFAWANNEKSFQAVFPFHNHDPFDSLMKKGIAKTVHVEEDPETTDSDIDQSLEDESSSEMQNLVFQAEESATESPLEPKLARLRGSKRPFIEYIPLRTSRTSNPRHNKHARISLRDIFASILHHVDRAQRLQITASFFCAAVHAAIIPLFSYCFSQLVGTYFDTAKSDEPPALLWSLAILALAVVDGIISHCMRLLLDQCSQSWVDNLRIIGFRRILDQPCAWFDGKGHSPQKLSYHLDQDAEDTKGLLSHFASAVLMATLMMTLALVYSLLVCWKITLASLAAIPLLLIVTSLCSVINTRWEKRSMAAVQAVNAVVDETFRDVKCTKAWSLEHHFCSKHYKVTEDAYQVGIRQAAWSGLVFGIPDAAVTLVIGESSNTYVQWKAEANPTASIPLLVWILSCRIRRLLSPIDTSGVLSNDLQPE